MPAISAGGKQRHNGFSSLMQTTSLPPGKFDVQYAAAIAAPEEVAVIYSPWQHIGLFDNQWSPSGPLVRPDVDPNTVSRILKDREFGYVGPTLVRRRAMEVDADSQCK